MNEDNRTTIWDVLGGNESLKIDIALDYTTIIYIGIAVFVVGIALVAISKAWPNK